MRRFYSRRDALFPAAGDRREREIEEAWPKLNPPMNCVKRNQGVAVLPRPLCISDVGGRRTETLVPAVVGAFREVTGV